ncbi:conserved hypothetical protein (putative transposase or invertase) [Lachnospiraceae bacterium KHCPX20]|nr:conserved hypothetical protein (putative transposase or invertase) [Lachnospiraceae bacterium KHCPX20]
MEEQKDNYLARTVRDAYGMEQYDIQAKKILADKYLLAVIMAAVVEEFHGMDIDEVMESIDGDPEVETGRIICDGEEDAILTGGRIHYDIKFTVHIKQSGNIKLYMNLEAQRDYYPGYDLVTRGIYYGATMLSTQWEKEIRPEDYSNLKKVYSIWLCMNSSEQDANTITEYSIHPTMVYGEPKRIGRYDLISVIMIRLSNKGASELTRETMDAIQRMNGALYTIFKSKKTATEKCKDLQENYGIPVSETFENEVKTMCNFSEVILEKGFEEGREKGREEGMEKGFEKGEERTRREAIRNMLKFGVSKETIATEYPLELVEQIIREKETGTDK